MSQFDESSTQSQTGSPLTPAQIENVQYNIPVQGFFSRVALAFMVAATSLSVVVLAAAILLHGSSGEIFGFAYANVRAMVVLFVSLGIPLFPLYMFTSRKLNVLLQDPLNREDVIFKKHLRIWLIITLLMGVLSIFSGIFYSLHILFLDGVGSVTSGFFFALWIGGAFGILAYWCYSFQMLTKR